MLFVIHAVDRPGALAARSAAYEAHREFLDRAPQYGVSIVMAGPLVEDDGSTAKGSLFLIDAASRSAVEAFNAADPFSKAGIWGDVSITAFLRRRG